MIRHLCLALGVSLGVAFASLPAQEFLGKTADGWVKQLKTGDAKQRRDSPDVRENNSRRRKHGARKPPRRLQPQRLQPQKLRRQRLRPQALQPQRLQPQALQP